MSASEETIIEQATRFSRDLEHTSPQYATDTVLPTTMRFLEEEVNETHTAIDANDLAEIIDGFGDCAFIALNGIYKTFRRLGYNHDKSTHLVTLVMQRICTANLAKLNPDGSVTYVKGKVQKPTSWKPPQYEDIIDEALAS